MCYIFYTVFSTTYTMFHLICYKFALFYTNILNSMFQLCFFLYNVYIELNILCSALYII